MKADLLRFDGAQPRDPGIDAWFKNHYGELGDIARHWFKIMRNCGDEVRELLHGRCPIACLGDVPFAYVNVFNAHVNVDFFQGVALSDPAHLLLGTGKYMRHVKLKPGTATDTAPLTKLIEQCLLRHKGAHRKRLKLGTTTGCRTSHPSWFYRDERETTSSD